MASLKADSYNRLSLSDIAAYIYYYFPFSSYGSHEKVEAWLKQFTKKQGNENG